MARYDPRAELAPRDIVARSIVREMERHGVPNVWLDATHLAPGEFAQRFPTIHAYCVSRRYDPEHEPIPVSPAAHYMMGGVCTDSWGRTSLPGLFACGETASTGVHGANRLASNSLLEGVVFGARVAQAVLSPSASSPWPDGSSDAESLTLPHREHATPPVREPMRALMWEHVGLLRHGAGLAHARASLEAQVSGRPLDTLESHETANLALVGWVMAEAALRREESRGAHHRLDFPAPRPDWRRRQRFVVRPGSLLRAEAVAAACQADVEVRS